MNYTNTHKVQMIGLTTKQKLVKQWESRYKALPSPLVALIEIKAVKSDFLADYKMSRNRHPANVALLA